MAEPLNAERTARLLMEVRDDIRRMSETDTGKHGDLTTSDWIALMALAIGDVGRDLSEVDCGTCSVCRNYKAEAEHHLVRLAAVALAAAQNLELTDD